MDALKRPCMLSKLRTIAGLDIQVLATVVLRAWGVLAGLVTTLLLPLFLSPTEQGFYYTFGSVLALQIFFELGLNHVLTQLAGHSAAHLQRGSDGSLQGELKWRRAVGSLLSLSRKWNAIMATLFAIALLAGGYFFFACRGTLPLGDWLGPWIVLVAATSVNLALSARLAICEGIGQVAEVARLRLRHSILGNTMLWLLLITGQRLSAVVAVPLAGAVITSWWLHRHPPLRRLRREMAAAPPANSDEFQWRRDIFPLQWRIALSWASGYFIFSFMTPVVFALQGPVDAGRLGLALTIFTAVTTIGMSWIAAKIPAFAAHIARQERTALNALFAHQARRAMAVTLLCSLTVVIGAAVVGHYAPSFAERLPPPSSMLLLATVTVANAAVFAMAAYMRAHKEEPLLTQSLTTAALVGTGVFVGAHHSLEASVAVYAAVTWFFTLPWCFIVFKNYYARRT